MKNQNPFLTFPQLILSVIFAFELALIFTPLALAAEPVTAETAPIQLLIPGIGLDSTVIPVGVKWLYKKGNRTYGTWEVAENDVGWHNLSASLGQIGNTVLAGHSDIKAKIFRHLKYVDIGDEIIALAGNGAEYRYIVAEKFLVQEKGVSEETRIKNAQWIAPTQDERLTLVTCASPGATHRLIVIARPAAVDQ